MEEQKVYNIELTETGMRLLKRMCKCYLQNNVFTIEEKMFIEHITQCNIHDVINIK